MKLLFNNILKSQHGVAVVMFAFILPLLILSAAITVDFGNVYFHKSQLQNMADAAILASAKEYENDPQSSNLSKITDEYIEKNLENNSGFNNPVPSTNPYPIITHKNDSTKLQLTLTENVPLYFFRVFGYNEMKISARSTALVSSESGWPFKDLITFSQSMNVNQGHQNNVYNTTFDGNIRFIPPASKNNITSQNNNNRNSNTEIANSIYTSEEISASNSEHSLTPIVSLDKMPDFANTPYEYSSLIENADNKHVASSQNVYSNDLTGNIVYLNGTNLTININQALPGSNDPALQNKPLYVVYANKDGMINLHVSADTVRPLVIYYLGATVNYNPSSSGIYRGVIYTPNAQLWVNENRADFRGSIYAKTFYSQVSGTYVYKAYSDNKSSGGSSIKLVDDDE